MSSQTSANAKSLAQLQWLALALTPSLGPTRGYRLAADLGGVERLFQASLTELEAANIPAAAAQSIATGKSMILAEEEMIRAAAAGAAIVALDDDLYPAQLKQIYDPPLVLYVRGDAAVISRPGVAVVGTRHPTPYGIGMAERLASDLAANGLVIFSGLARGIDSCAHRGALAGRGATVGILGTGIDVIYPKENTRLVSQILAQGGAVITEFPVETFPAPQNFPIRNRIISGISVGVLVIEAGEYSGTRVTARCALEQSREVYAVPGNVTNKNSWGPNTLIKQGAKLVATWEDVWEELPTAVREQLHPPPKEVPDAPRLFDDVANLSPHEKKIYRILKADESTHIDDIVELLEKELSSSEIFEALFELELAGKVRQMPGKNYVRTF